MNQLFKGLGGGLLGFVKRVLKIQHDDGGYIELNGGKRVYELTAGITAGSTAVPAGAPAGSLGVTSHATGAQQVFISDGTYWQDHNGQEAVLVSVGTIATGAPTNAYGSAPVTGKLIAAILTGVDALAQHASNYQTFSLTNVGQTGAGTAAMLAATDANTTKTSTGAAIAANTPRTLTKTSTAADLATTLGDRLKFTSTPSGTPANTVTGATLLLIFQRSYS